MELQATDSRWEKFTRFFSDEANHMPVGTSDSEMDCWSRFAGYCRFIMRKVDRKMFLTSIIALFGITILTFELVRLDVFRAIGLSKHVESVFVESLTKPEFCTTWPVSEQQQPYTPLSHEENNGTSHLDSIAPPGGWVKPDGVRIVGLIFYGRRRNVDILDCYLLQNLAINGGYLDEVRFIVHTKKSDDLDYLDQLIKEREGYRIEEVGPCQGGDYSCMWDSSTEDNTIYIKIDDDIAFIHPDAIPQLVNTRIAEPHPYIVSANLVNSPLTGTLHYYFGAIHPLVPDNRTTPSFAAAETWRQSDKPLEVDFNSSKQVDGSAAIPQVPYSGHTWHLLSDDSYDLKETPMGVNIRANVNSPYKAAWQSWAIAAQQHYSLLINLERNEMFRYFFGTRIPYPKGKNAEKGSDAPTTSNRTSGPGAEQLYDTQYVRYNLNFIAIWGHDVKKALPMAADDEEHITVSVPKRVKRPAVIDTRSVVSHFSFFPQIDGMKETDLLDRYRAYANEMVCKPNNRKSPFDVRCKGF